MRRRLRSFVPATVALAVVVLFATLAIGRPAAPPADPAPAPSNLSVSTRSTIAVVSWTGSADRYRVEVATDSSFANPIEVETSDSIATVAGLTPATSYLVRVRAVAAGGASAVSSAVSLVTPAEDFRYLAPVVKLSSQASASLTAAWPAAADKVQYLAEVARDETFATPTTEVVTEPEATFTELAMGHTYVVRVRVVDSERRPLSEWSQVVSTDLLKAVPLTVGSYNILKSRAKNWSARKPALARTILSVDPDVVGLQEATPRKTASGRRQYADLVAALGSDWALTDADKGTSGEVRTVYNTKRLELVSHGYSRINGSTARGIPRFITWAQFTQLSTGKQFLFVNTHFLPRTSSRTDSRRVSAARQLVALIKRVNTADLPVVIAGDFNTGMNRTSGNRVYTSILAGGYRDPLAAPSSRLGHAESKVRANLKTVNRYRRVAPRDSWAPMVDHIFVSPMKVKVWEVVARLNSAGRFVGTIPSDHNMIRVTVELP